MWYNRGEITKGVICIDLKLGKKYKYNQLCSIFNIKPERGSKQKSQLSALREKYNSPEKENGSFKESIVIVLISELVMKRSVLIITQR